MRLYLIHTKHVMSMGTNQYGAYVVAADTNAEAQTKLEESGNLLNARPISYEEILRTEVLDVDALDPLIAFIYYGPKKLDLSSI